MDKRFQAMTMSEQAKARLTLYQEIEQQPGMALSAILRLIRTRLRVTRTELSRMTQLSVRYLQAIEQEQANPTLSVTNQILAPFGLTMGVVMAKLIDHNKS